MSKGKGIFLTASFFGIFYVLAMLLIRLHITQQAYVFDDLKDYERSLKEEQRRLRLEIAELLSPDYLKMKGFEEPQPDQIARIP